MRTQMDPFEILAARGRAREQRLASQLSGDVTHSPIGPLPNTGGWDDYFSMMDEANGGKPTKFAQETSDMPLMQSEKALNAATPYRMQPMAPSNQLGMMSLSGLKRR